jgi:hypothetical protein
MKSWEDIKVNTKILIIDDNYFISYIYILYTYQFPQGIDNLWSHMYIQITSSSGAFSNTPFSYSGSLILDYSQALRKSY